MLTNPGKLSLSKGIAMFVSDFFPKLSNQKPKDRPDWNILDIWALLSFISVGILLAKASLNVVICLVVRNNSCDNSSSSKFFLYNLLILKSDSHLPKKFCVISLIESPLEAMKNAFYFILKALFVLKIFKFLSRLFGNVGKTALLERSG